tara:strand:- start:688 stop:2898 length:2211 start_codon:yes stop_codon:yes gene_type:complete
MPKEKNIISWVIIFYMIVLPGTLFADEKREIDIRSIDAKVIESDEGNLLKLKGNVIIKTDTVELWSDEALYDRENQEIRLQGNVRALSKNLSVNAEKMKADFLNNAFYLSESNFTFMQRGFGKAQSVSLKINENIELLNVSISSCKNEDIAWNLEASEITILDDRSNVVTKDVKVKVNDVPILYLPYIRSAIGKENFSGFLTPSIKQGKDGLDLSIPYFFSLASNYDLTISPRYIEERGSGLSTEGRFLTNNSKGTLAFSYFSDDRKFNAQTGYGKKRWATKVNSYSNLGSNLYIKLDTEHVSDNLYFEDLNDDILGTQQKDFLTRSLAIRFDKENFILKGKLNQFQNLNPFSYDEYETRPHVNFDYHNKFNNLGLRLITDYSKFSYEENYNPLEKDKHLKRIYIEPSLSFEKNSHFSFLSFKTGKRNVAYDNDISSVDNSYKWAELTYKVFLNKREGSKFKSLSPITKLVWIDGENRFNKSVDSKFLNLNFDTLFNKNWYSGSDLFLEQNRMILGFEHNSYDTSNGDELYISLGRAFFNEQEVNLRGETKHSSYVAELITSLSGNLSISGTLEIASNLETISSGQLGLIYTKDQRNNIQLRSVYKRDVKYLNKPSMWDDADMPINQLELISQWELSDKFLFFGKISKDLEINYSRDISYGVEYSNCCLKFGVMKRKWKDQNYYNFFNMKEDSINLLNEDIWPERERDNIYFFFELTEMGRFGKTISEVLTSRSFQ